MDSNAMKLRLEGYSDMLAELKIQSERLRRKIEELGDIRGIDYSKGNVCAPPGNPVASEILAVERLAEEVDDIAEREHDEHEALERMVSRIGNVEQRAVIRMKYFDGMGWDDIASFFYGERADFETYRSDYIHILHKTHTRAVASMARMARRAG